MLDAYIFPFGKMWYLHILLYPNRKSAYDNQQLVLPIYLGIQTLTTYKYCGNFDMFSWRVRIIQARFYEYGGPKGPISVMEVGSIQCSCINMQRKFFLCKSILPFFLLGSRTFNPAFTRSIIDPKYPVYMTRDHPAIIHTQV